MWGGARGVALVVTVGFVAAAAGDARADEPSEANAATAESLFQEGRKLMDAKRYALACPKLAASHKLAPAVGALLNLADCYERGGQLASAWTRFHEAITMAQRLGQADREKTARERADKLEPRLIKLTISGREPGLEVKLDGNPLAAGSLGAPVPIDPGTHTIDATAKGKKPFSATVDLSERVKTPTVAIPALTPLEGEPSDPKVVVPPPPGGDVHLPEEPAPAGSTGSTQRIIGIGAMGLGGVGLVLGTVFGLKASSKWSDAKDNHCTGLECDRTGVELAASAKNAGTVSTISFIAGGVFLAGGAVLLFTAPKAAKKNDVTVGLGPGNLTLRGSF